MDLQYLKKLLKIFDDSTAEDLEIEEKGIKLKISKNKEDKVNGNVPIINLSGALPSNQNYQPQHQHVQPTTTPSQPSAPAETKVETSVGLHEIKAPMVGTYYAAPSPDSEDFVKVGQKIKKGQTLCIVEAMKLMNEIESDIDGEIVKILSSDTEAVEYNQVLFHIKPN
jgi:acetyl-CoA carboxylase biotin carboxyl carrier protein